MSESVSEAQPEPGLGTDPPESFAPYQALLTNLEHLGAGLDRLHGANLTCRQGCSGCCHQHLGVFAVEADALAPVLQALSAATHATVLAQAGAVLAGQREACPLLIDDQCSVYAARPVICRTHGYPLHYEAETEGEILLDVCPLNFTAPDSLESLELSQTLPLDRLNLRLTAINYVYCRDEVKDLAQADVRIPLAELAISALNRSRPPSRPPA